MAESHNAGAMPLGDIQGIAGPEMQLLQALDISSPALTRRLQPVAPVPLGRTHSVCCESKGEIKDLVTREW